MDREKLPFDWNSIFEIKDLIDFNQTALKIFRFQYERNTVYQTYCKHLEIIPKKIEHYSQIPFLPIEFFKGHEIRSFNENPQIIFTSSGTTGMNYSQHLVKDVEIYKKSFIKGFEHFYGPIEDYLFLGLLPSYLKRQGSSLIYMVQEFIDRSNHKDCGFFLDDYEFLIEVIRRNKGKKILLIGVSYALLDLAEKYHPDLSDCIVVETGGMKGRRKELTKDELHKKLKKGFSTDLIHSEYGMTELLSQAYSNGLQFKCPPWMKVLTRAYNDPFEWVEKKTGGLNIIDLANVYSCSFIATQDLGKLNHESFEVLGRFDHSDLRGCNLLVQ